MNHNKPFILIFGAEPAYDLGAGRDRRKGKAFKGKGEAGELLSDDLSNKNIYTLL